MTPLVLLPGMMCNARLFAPQIEALSKERVVTVAPITEHETVEALADEVLRTSPDTFALAGVSMGGIVAMEIIAKASERIERLALLDTNPLAEQADVSLIRLRQIDEVENGHLESVMRDEMKPLYLFDSPARDTHLALCMEMALSLGRAVFIRQSKSLALRRDQCDTLKGINIPTLVLCGRHDKLCSVQRHEFMHELIPNSTLAIVEDAGHLPTIEKPGETNELLLEWMRM